MVQGAQRGRDGESAGVVICWDAHPLPGVLSYVGLLLLAFDTIYTGHQPWAGPTAAPSPARGWWAPVRGGQRAAALRLLLSWRMPVLPGCPLAEEQHAILKISAATYCHYRIAMPHFPFLAKERAAGSRELGRGGQGPLPLSRNICWPGCDGRSWGWDRPEHLPGSTELGTFHLFQPRLPSAPTGEEQNEGCPGLQSSLPCSHRVHASPGRLLTQLKHHLLQEALLPTPTPAEHLSPLTPQWPVPLPVPGTGGLCLSLQSPHSQDHALHTPSILWTPGVERKGCSPNP